MLPLIIGGAAALGSGIANYLEGQDRAKAAAEAYDKIVGLGNAAEAQNAADIEAYKQMLAGTYGAGNAAYSQALADFLNSPVYQNEGFSYSGDIGQFMDPAANQRVDAAMQAIANSAASGGNRFSSDYVNRVGAKQQAMASEEWEKAYNRLMQDRQQQMSEWNANSQNAWNNFNAANDRAKYAVDAYGNDRNAYVQGMGNVMSAGLQNRNANLQTQADAIGGTVNAQNSAPGLGSSILSPVASFMGNFFGG